MTILLAFFGFFTILSAVALVKFEGNPIFIFTLLLCIASLVTVWRADAESATTPTGRGSGRRSGRRRR